MSVTPDFVGQIYKDTSTGNLWRSNSTTPGDWTLEVQNMQVKWTPTTLKLGESIGFLSWNDIAGLQSIVFSGVTSSGGFDLENLADIVSLSFPNMVSIDPTGASFAYTFIAGFPSLTTVSFPSLVTVGNDINISGCPLLTNLDLHSLVTCVNGVFLDNNTSLTSISLPNLVDASEINVSGCTNLTTLTIPLFVPSNGKNSYFNNCALSETVVNAILARFVANASYVAGTVDLSGGTNAAPSGQGIIDVATLSGRGVVVTTN